MKPTRRAERSRKLFVRLKPKQQVKPVNPNNWSESSKRSLIFSLPPAHYEDISYHCVRCGRNAVFTAADQKLAFEGRKAYIWQRRKRCSGCWGERQRIMRGIHECQARWRAHKRELQSEAGFLRQWLGLLETYPDYGGRKDHAGISMLRRLVDASGQSCTSSHPGHQNLAAIHASRGPGRRV